MPQSGFRTPRAARRARARLTKPAFVVGNFARRLRDGQHRSREAEDYARAIGMPLKDWQTVVQTRGGTEEEREALLEALERDEMPIDRWRARSALDVIQTASLQKTDGRAADNS